MANTPPPPPDNNEGYAYPEPPEGGGSGAGGGNGGGGDGGGSSLGPAAPAVAAPPGRVHIIMLVVVASLGFIIYSLFSGGKPAPEKPKTPKQIVAVPPPSPVEIVPPATEAPIALPPPSTPPLPPVEPPALPPIEPPAVNTKAPSNAARQQRIKSSMLVLNGNSHQSADSSTLKPTGAAKATATKMDNLAYTIAQGKLIEAVLETAINTTLQGPIRAIVSRDIFAESGKLVLIPKGSRLIGTYNAAVQRGQARVLITWARVIRPDGIDVALDSPGVDALGRSGMTGYVDNKFIESYANAILTSIIDVGVATAGQKLIGGNVSTTANPEGNATTTGSAGAMALQQSVGNISDVSKKVVSSVLDERPTITVDQGERINVFVNKDLVFPPESVSGGKILP